MAKFKITSEQAERIEALVLRLKNAITTLDVVRWLQNFNLEELDSALTVAEAINYFTIPEIIDSYDQSLKKILKDVPPDKTIFVHGIGAVDKSGNSMLYYLAQTPTYQHSKKRFVPLAHPRKLRSQGLNEGSYLLLVDDIIGSGKSVVTYYTDSIRYQLVKEKFSLNIIALSIVYMEDAIEHLNTSVKNLSVYGTMHRKAFSSRGSVFGYRPKMLELRELCYGYGKDLFLKFDYNLKKDVYHPLGFNGSQSLVAFAHSVPNNTLPVIWSTRNSWQPLFPRKGDGKISQSRGFRNETRHWASMAVKLNLLEEKDTKGQILYSGTNFKLLAVMRLRRVGSVFPKICQTLGITSEELDIIIQEGVKSGILDNNGNLTTKGIEMYDEIKKKIRISSTKDLRKEPILAPAVTYVPKIFSGRT